MSDPNPITPLTPRARLVLRCIAAQGLLLLVARVALRIGIGVGVAPDWDGYLRLLRVQANTADLCVVSSVAVFAGVFYAEGRVRRRSVVLLGVLGFALLAAGLIRA
jgi:hypothetical protein